MMLGGWSATSCGSEPETAGEAPESPQAGVPSEAAPAGGGAEPVGEGARRTAASGPAVYRANEVARYPHDRTSFTQGLLWHGGWLYETTGRHGHSKLRRLRLESGVVDREVSLDEEFFGEGLARVGNELLWLTWRSERGFRFALEDFEALGSFEYQGEGWGLCNHDGALYRSDGSATLWRHHIGTFEPELRTTVRSGSGPVTGLNELECTREGIWANVYGRDFIIRIDPATGRVTARADLGHLLPPSSRPPNGVVNGIAYRPETGSFLVTGKLWPALFEVVLEPES